MIWNLTAAGEFNGFNELLRASWHPDWLRGWLLSADRGVALL
jgi:hypothetical protein